MTVLTINYRCKWSLVTAWLLISYYASHASLNRCDGCCFTAAGVTTHPLTSSENIASVFRSQMQSHNHHLYRGKFSGVFSSVPSFPFIHFLFSSLSPALKWAPQIQLTDLGSTVSSPAGENDIYSHQTRALDSKYTKNAFGNVLGGISKCRVIFLC